MHWKPSSRPSGRRLVAAAAAVASAGTLLLGAPGIAGARPKPQPKHRVTQGQVNAAQSVKDALAAKVGALSGEIAQAQVLLQQLQGKAELAEQKYALAESQVVAAKAAAVRAQAAVQTAIVQVDKAHADFVQYVQATYMSGDVGGTAGSLLTASDPSALLDQSALEQYQQQHQADAIGALQVATVAKSNADARAKLAVEAAKLAEARAAQERDAARAAFVAEQQQKAALQQTMAQRQQQLTSAREQLLRLSNDRQQYLDYLSALHAWEVQQAEIAAARRRAAQLARERAREAQQQQGNSGGGSGGGSGWSPGPSAPSGGGWTAAKGQQAANRALSQLGMPYAWAGGGAYGPSRGVCDPSNGAPNDCYVIGYDCSGLAMYAWGASWWAHYAATQYTQAGSYHPSAADLMPGDLIFWSSDGTIAGIHHVAIYIGNQQIVEAPYSGAYVQVASLYEYGGYFGATRPLT